MDPYNPHVRIIQETLQAGQNIHKICKVVPQMQRTSEKPGKGKMTPTKPENSPERQVNKETDAGAVWGFSLVVMWGAVEPLWVTSGTLWVSSGRVRLALRIVCDPTRDPAVVLFDPTLVILQLSRETLQI